MHSQSEWGSNKLGVPKERMERKNIQKLMDVLIDRTGHPLYYSGSCSWHLERKKEKSSKENGLRSHKVKKEGGKLVKDGC